MTTTTETPGKGLAGARGGTVPYAVVPVSPPPVRETHRVFLSSW